MMMTKIKRVFKIDGKPFFPIGGQTRNSSGYNPEEWTTAFDALAAIHGNTLEIPVYWEQIEPEEGTCDFTALDALLAEARRRGSHLVLLWFGTWKNGNMEYVPEWVKTDPQRFKRVISPTGQDLWVLSSHCDATFEADRRAFTALCQHLKAVDEEDHTVIALQIENEPGILGSDRDYSAQGQAALERAVPEQIIAHLQAGAGGAVHDLWRAAGGATAGDWVACFGDAGGELMTAWSIARFIDRLAEAGKALLDCPMYLNVWLGEVGWHIPGESYPSGGAVTKVLDLYKWATPHIDLIAPDIYLGDAQGYEAICRAYAREDNPLFVPESAPGGSNPLRMFRAIGAYNAIGYAYFAIEHILDGDGNVRTELQPLVDSFRCVAAAIPLLLAYQGTDRIHVIAQEADLGAQILDFDGYIGMVTFDPGPLPRGGKDWRHAAPSITVTPSPGTGPGRGLIVQTGAHEFYCVGANYRLHLRRKRKPAEQLRAAEGHPFLMSRLTHYVRVDEGRFDKNGAFVVDRRRNGDETDNGVWVEPDVIAVTSTAVVHMVLCD
jgi:beta-galactosidase GanA